MPIMGRVCTWTSRVCAVLFMHFVHGTVLRMIMFRSDPHVWLPRIYTFDVL
jgi:hypothetical protein